MSNVINALRANVDPTTLAYLDELLAHQIDTLASEIAKTQAYEHQITSLQKALAQANHKIEVLSNTVDAINNHLDDNCNYSLTRSKVVRLLKKEGLY